MKACFGLPVVVLLVGGGMMAGSRTDFVPDGRTGSAIQRAIDAAAAGGGRVVLEKGVYESGTLYLKSHVELHVPEGCVLRGGSRPEDYDDVDDPRITKSPEKSKKAFIACIGEEDVAITGGGVIDGQGVKFYDTSKRKWGMYPKPPHPRTRMVQFFRCRNVRFEGVSFLNPPSWTLHIIDSEHLLFRRAKLWNDLMCINCDGLDLDGCRHVRVEDCDFHTGDDALVVRAILWPGGSPRAVLEDVVVKNSPLSSVNANNSTVTISEGSPPSFRGTSYDNLSLVGTCM